MGHECHLRTEEPERDVDLDEKAAKQSHLRYGKHWSPILCHCGYYKGESKAAGICTAHTSDLQPKEAGDAAL